MAHEIWLTRPDGTPIAVLENYTYLRYTQVVNGFGRFEIRMPSDFDRSLMGLDHLVEIWRAPPGGKLQWQMTGMVREWGGDSRRGRTSYVMKGPSQNGLIDRMIVAYKGGQTESQKSGKTDDIMKELVDEARGSSAGNDPYGRSRIMSNFTIAADVTAGPQYDGDFQWQTMVDVLQDLSDHSYSQGTAVYWQVVQTSSGNFQFRTYINQIGIDRTIDPVALTFGEEFGNMRDVTWREDWSRERNIIYGGGQGEGQDRTIDPEKDVGRIYRTQWNRTEAFQDARGESTTLGVAKKAFARLVDSRPRRHLSGRLISVPGSLYGEHWGFGDKVPATAFGFQFEGVVQSVTITVSDKRKEDINARIEAEYTNLG
jgi:hypothetical protein